MRPSMKYLTVVGLATGLGKMLSGQASDETVKERASEIADAGLDALAHCKYKVDKSALRRSEKYINEICVDGDSFDSIELLSLALVGVQELGHYIKKDRHLTMLEKRLLQLIEFLDPDFSSNVHESAHNKYAVWSIQ